jgi:hypothetical protein
MDRPIGVLRSRQPPSTVHDTAHLSRSPAFPRAGATIGRATFWCMTMSAAPAEVP